MERQRPAGTVETRKTKQLQVHVTTYLEHYSSTHSQRVLRSKVRGLSSDNKEHSK